MANVVGDERRPNRDARFTVRLDEGELAAVKHRAAQLGVAPSAFVRACVLDAVQGADVPTVIASTIEPPQAASRDLVDLRVAVTRVGTNVNQIARLCNTHGAVVMGPGDAVGSFTTALMECRDTLRKVEDALGGTRRAGGAS